MPERVEGIFKKRVFIFKHFKQCNYFFSKWALELITNKNWHVKNGKKNPTQILLLMSQSRRSGKFSSQYSTKLKCSTVKVTSFHFFAVVLPSGVSRAKCLMAIFGSRARFLYFISNPQSLRMKCNISSSVNQLALAGQTLLMSFKYGRGPTVPCCSCRYCNWLYTQAPSPQKSCPDTPAHRLCSVSWEQRNPCWENLQHLLKTFTWKYFYATKS